MDDKKKIEAVLFTTGRFMTTQEIAEACELGSVGYVKELLQELHQDYTSKDGALALIEHDGRFKMNIKKEYGHLTNKLVSTTEFDGPTIKTLAIIAYKSPVMQSDIIKIRGTTAYDHIKILKENGLITTDKSGRTRIIKLAQKFYDYFDIAEKEVKEEFQKVQQQVKDKYDKLKDAIGATPDEPAPVPETTSNQSEEQPPQPQQ